LPSKTFKPKYRNAESVENTQSIAVFKDVPGLSVTRRLAIIPEVYPNIVQKNEALLMLS